jgi:hypothetical protein
VQRNSVEQRVLREKLRIFQLVEIFLVIYKTLIFIIVLATARNWTMSWATSVETCTPNLFSFL